MIKHHPNEDILKQHMKGTLSPLLSTAVAAHIEMCPKCQNASATINIELSDEFISDAGENFDQSVDTDHISLLVAEIVALPKDNVTSISPRSQANKTIQYGSRQFTLPKALQRYSDSKWTGFAGVNRARVPESLESTKGSFLYIEPGANIPEHTHKGNELTLLLEGTFEDKHGKYVPGDFIWLNQDDQHQPITEKGCLCFVVCDAPLHFTQGASRLLNPIGKLIY